LKVDFDDPEKFESLCPASQASVMAEVERMIKAHRQLGPDATPEQIKALYDELRPEHDGELVYVLDEDIA
jgi:hypothetical protein